jgi:TolB-like protein/Tfp pilus assembly protein PilF
MSFITELKRRNVFRIAAAYVLVAWIIMQVTDLAAPALRLPAWVPSLVVFLLLIGLPVALLLAWAFEVTPEGIQKTKDIPLGQNISRFGGRKLDFVVIGLLIGVIFMLIIDRNRPARSPEPVEPSTASGQELDETSNTPTTMSSIAVLPFANMSEDPEQEHFADGLAEELLNSLAAVSDLRVISRTSSFAFKDSDESIVDIAQSLQVEHILEGSVRRAGDTIRITAQLIDTSSDSHIWSNTYDRQLNLDNILEIQDEIAAKVVDALNLRLRPHESVLVSSKGPANLPALDHYNDGKFYMSQIATGQSLSPATFVKARDSLEAAIAADPDWAPAHAALGSLYHFSHGDGFDASPSEDMRTSMRYVMDAIRLDKNFGPAYASLAYILATTGEFDRAIRAFEQARALNSNVFWAYAIMMKGLGRHEEAIENYQKAALLNPLSMLVKEQLEETYMCSGRYAEAINSIESDDGIFVNDATNLFRQMLLSESYSSSGDTEKGLALAESVAGKTENTPYLAAIFAVAGNCDRARALLASQEATDASGFLNTAYALAVLGDEQSALTMLERGASAAQEESNSLMALDYIHCSPEIQGYAGNPRYEALLNKLDMPD